LQIDISGNVHHEVIAALPCVGSHSLAVLCRTPALPPCPAEGWLDSIASCLATGV